MSTTKQRSKLEFEPRSGDVANPTMLFSFDDDGNVLDGTILFDHSGGE